VNTFAYCCASFGRRLGRLARTSPILSPPVTAETFDLELLAGRDLVWFKLHGREGERYWYGDNWTTALSARRVASARLAGAVVFVSNCWLCDQQGLPSPMLIALARANARAIIGGAGTNYALENRIGGTDLLGLYFRFFREIGFSVRRAFRFAQARLRLHRPRLVAEDTLAFRLWRPQDVALASRGAACPEPVPSAARDLGERPSEGPTEGARPELVEGTDTGHA
jgi:hypothetical protein